MGLDIEKGLLWCLPCAARTTAGRKRVAGLQPFKVGIRFHKVAADILGPVTMAKASKAKHILVITDMFTKFVVSTPLVGTESEDVAQAIVEKWVLKFGVPDVLHTHQGKNFGSQLILDMCKLLKIDKTLRETAKLKGTIEFWRMSYPSFAQIILGPGTRCYPM